MANEFLKYALSGFSSSPDALTWTSIGGLSGSNVVVPSYGNGLWLTVLYNSAISETSPDGITWTSHALPSNQLWNGVAFGNGVWVVCSAQNVVSTSPDGITWTNHTFSTLSGANQIIFAGGRFVVVGGGASATSSDGYTWTESAQSWIGTTCIAYGAGEYVALTNNYGTGGTSSDGLTWTTHAVPVEAYESLSFGAGLFCVFLNITTAAYLTSPDGITWTTRGTLPASRQWPVRPQGSIFADGRFVVVTSDSSAGIAAVSFDGLTWSSNSLPTANNYGVTYPPAVTSQIVMWI